jgi:Putative DNA-binding domain
MNPNMQLSTLQSQFQAAVREGASPGALLKGPQAERGLQAYRTAYPARLAEALQDNYSVLHQALGDELFAGLAQAYLRAHPPTEPSIRWYGHALAGFMDAWDGLPHPALADLARLDWALRSVFDAAAAPALTPETLAATPPQAWGQLPLRLQSHVHLVPLQWAVGPAWHALAAARDTGEPAALPPPEALAHTLLAWRQSLQPQWRSLAADEAQALDLVQASTEGPPLHLADWLGHCLSAHGEDALPQAVAWLQQWTHDGLLLVSG